MQVTTTIQLSRGDTFDLTSDEAADAVLKALGGDEDKDGCVINILAESEQGQAGTVPSPPVMQT